MNSMSKVIAQLTAAALLLTGLFISPSYADSNERPWRLVKHKNDIYVYMRHSDASKIKTFRGVTKFRTTRPFSVQGIVNDYSNMPNWLHFVSSAEELDRRNYFDRDMRFKTRLPWPLTDREAVINADVKQDKETSNITITLTNRPDLIPPNKSYIRFPEFDGRFDFEIVGITEQQEYVVEVTYEIVIDPGGAVPNWLANIVLTDTPYYTLRRFVRLIDSGKYNDYTDNSGISFPPMESFDEYIE